MTPEQNARLDSIVKSARTGAPIAGPHTSQDGPSRESLALRTVWYRIEELIPAASAIGGREFWTVLESGGHPFRCNDLQEAERVFQPLRASGRKVRLVRVTEEVVSGTEPAASEAAEA